MTKKNRGLGLAGENLVILIEKNMLIDKGKAELAEKIKHISKFYGDGTGYDIMSFTPEGELKYIEVKTTKDSRNTSFFMSRNEKKFAETHKNKYYLYRVFEYDSKTNSGKCFILWTKQVEVVQ